MTFLLRFRPVRVAMPKTVLPKASQQQQLSSVVATTLPKAAVSRKASQQQQQLSSAVPLSNYILRHQGVTAGGARHAGLDNVDDDADDADAAAAANTVTFSSLLDLPVVKRFLLTAEVAVSKIFPAGFGWQMAATMAGDMGYQATDVSFALMTGAGDFAGVLLGHSAYYTLKHLTGAPVHLTWEYKTGLFLASAAFFSGTAWQPVVNTLQAAELPLVHVAGVTTLACGAAFYAGLRVFRQLYSPFGLVRPSDYANLKSDAALSLSIGGATGCFVCTDVGYLPDQNPLVDVVGVLPTDSAVTACAKAGASTGTLRGVFLFSLVGGGGFLLFVT